MLIKQPLLKNHFHVKKTKKSKFDGLLSSLRPFSSDWVLIAPPPPQPLMIGTSIVFGIHCLKKYYSILKQHRIRTITHVSILTISLMEFLIYSILFYPCCKDVRGAHSYSHMNGMKRMWTPLSKC